MEYSPPLVSVRDCFQDTPWIPKSTDAQVPHVKWCGTMHTYPPYPQLVGSVHANPRTQRADCIIIHFGDFSEGLKTA